MELRFADRLCSEYERRKSKNSRYSIRAFATLLDIDHASLSQVMRGKRRVPADRIEEWAAKLSIEPEMRRAYALAEEMASSDARKRQYRLAQWHAETISVVSSPEHWQLFQVAQEHGLTVDSRRLAEEFGCRVDAINVALSRLLRLRLLVPTQQGAVTVDEPRNETEFRKTCLIRLEQELLGGD